LNRQISALENLKNTKKFSKEKWEKRGLNPSSENLCSKLEKLLDDLLTELISYCSSQKSVQEIEKIYEYYFEKIKSAELDTEEKEFVVDYFDEIARILDIQTNDVYDHEKAVKKASEKVLAEERKRHEIISIECSKCKALLDTFILERDKEIPSFEFDIIKCVKCYELNILDKGPGIKRYRFLNYELIEELPKEEYNLEKALIRLEHLRNS
jgi:hypothetical protein